MKFFGFSRAIIAYKLKQRVRNFDIDKRKKVLKSNLGQCREALLDLLKIRVRMVEERSVLIMSRFGKYRALPVGFHRTVPFLDRVVKTVSVEEQHLKTTNDLVHSADMLQITLNTSFSLKVTDVIYTNLFLYIHYV